MSRKNMEKADRTYFVSGMAPVLHDILTHSYPTVRFTTEDVENYVSERIATIFRDVASLPRETIPKEIGPQSTRSFTKPSPAALHGLMIRQQALQVEH